MSETIAVAPRARVTNAAAVLKASAVFWFVAQEKAPPYLVAVVTVSDAYLALGRREMRRAIDLWVECNTTGIWPGYAPSVAEPPAWAIEQELDPTVEAELLALINGGKK